jgi:hypothetical protein
MTPDQDRPSALATDALDPQPTIVSTKLTLHDLFTGGWKRPLTGLPTALGRPLARSARAARERAAGWRNRTSEPGAQQ